MQSHPARLCALPSASRTDDGLDRISQWLSGVEILAGTSADKLNALAKVARYRSYSRGAIIRHEDHKGPGLPELCVIYSGQVALCRAGQPVAYLEAGQTFGAIETIQSELAGAAAVATGRSGAELLILSQADYDNAAMRFRAGEAWEDVDFLSQHPLLEGWGRSELLRLRGSMIHRVYPAGELVCRQGEEPRALWLVKRGVCEAQRTRVERVAYSRGAGVSGTKTVRRRLLLGRILPGGIFGEAAAVRGTPRFADVVTVSVVELLELPSLSLLLLAKHNTLGVLADQVSRYPSDDAVEARLEAMVRGEEGAKHARAQMRRARLRRLAVQWSHSGVQSSHLRDADGSDLMLGGQVTGNQRRHRGPPRGTTAADEEDEQKQPASRGDGDGGTGSSGCRGAKDLATAASLHPESARSADAESKLTTGSAEATEASASTATFREADTAGKPGAVTSPARASSPRGSVGYAAVASPPLRLPRINAGDPSPVTGAVARASGRPSGASATGSLRSTALAVRAAARFTTEAAHRMVRLALALAPPLATEADEMIVERLQAAADERRDAAAAAAAQAASGTGELRLHARAHQRSTGELRPSAGRVLGAVGRRGSVSAVVGSTLERLDAAGGIRLDARASVHLSATPLVGGTGTPSTGKLGPRSDAGRGGKAPPPDTAASRLLMAMGTLPARRLSPGRVSAVDGGRKRRQSPAPLRSDTAGLVGLGQQTHAAPVAARVADRQGRRASISENLHSLKAAAISHSVATAEPAPSGRARSGSALRRPGFAGPAAATRPARAQAPGPPPRPIVPPHAAAPADAPRPGKALRRPRGPALLRAADDAESSSDAAIQPAAVPRERSTADKRLARVPPGSTATTMASGMDRSGAIKAALRQGQLTLQEAGRSMGLAPLLERGHAHTSGKPGNKAAAASPLTWQAVQRSGGGWEAAATAGAAAALQPKPSFVAGRRSQSGLTASAFAGMASVVAPPMGSSLAARPVKPGSIE